MLKNLSLNLKHIVLSFTLAMLAVSASAVDVTYSLTTHVDGRTMTELSRGQNPGAALALPKDLIRAYTSYTFYSDPELTQAITVVPTEDATVYVDYEFNGPMVMSTPDFPTPYSVGSGSTAGRFGTLNANGATSVTNPVDFADYTFFGDSYSFNLFSVEKGQWLTWDSNNPTRRVLSAEEPAIGWQMIINNNRESGNQELKRFALGTYSEQTNNGLYFIASQYETGGTNTTYENITVTTNENNAIIRTSSEGNTANSRQRRTSMFVFLTGQAQTPYSVTFKVYQDYPKYGQQRAQASFAYSKTFRPYNISNVATATKAIYQGLYGDGSGKPSLLDVNRYTYTFYKDEAMTEEYGENEYTEGKTSAVDATENITIYVKESWNGEKMDFVTDRWITICLPYGVSDVADFFGGEDAVLVNEFTGVEVQGSKYKLLFTQTNTIKPYTPYMFKANKVLDGKYLVLYNTVAPPTDTDYQSAEGEDVNEMYLSINHVASSSTVWMRGTFEGKSLVYDETKTQFFMGYKNNDPQSEGYYEETPNFYRISTASNVTIKPFRCWFEITDMNPSAGVKSLVLSFDGDDANAIDHVMTQDGSIQPVAPVYSLDGRQMSTNASFDTLKKGIYIVNGRKLVK